MIERDADCTFAEFEIARCAAFDDLTIDIARLFKRIV
jgi:hypothetical protein